MQEKDALKTTEICPKKVIKSTLDESERNFKTLSQKGPKLITKVQNFSQDELKQITRMLNLSQNELKQIAEKRRIKNCKNMSKEDLLIAL